MQIHSINTIVLYKFTSQSIKKRTIMTTLTKIIVTTLLSILLLSCNFDVNFGSINGTGNVISAERNISEAFTTVKTSHGLDVYLTQGDDISLTVEADENLQEIIQKFEMLSNNKPESENFSLITPIHINMGEIAYGTSAGYGELRFTLRTWTQEKIETLSLTILN